MKPTVAVTPRERTAPATQRRRHLPFVLVNMAMTADGKIATGNRAVSSFGSRRDREHLFALRATADAIMAGARTADLDPVTMGPGPARYRRLRLQRGLAEFPLRVIVSGAGSLSPEAEIFRHRFSPIILLTAKNIPGARLRRLRERASEVKVCGGKTINLHQALAWLGKRWKVKRLLCEGGGQLNDALFRARLVDELHLTICPKIFGGRNAPTIADGLGASRLSRAAQLQLKSARRVGNELFLVFGRKTGRGHSAGGLRGRLNPDSGPSTPPPRGRAAKADPRAGSEKQ